MTPKQKEVMQAYCEAIKPTERGDIVAWSKKHVPQVDSPISPTVDLNLTPWLIDPARAVVGGKYKIVCFSAPTGIGKSTVLSCIAAHIIAVDSGNTQVMFQSDGDAQIFQTTRIRPILENSELLKPIMAGCRTNDIKKDFIQFPHMTYYCDGANLSNTQSRSCRFLLFDEIAHWKQAILAEAKARTHRRWNAVIYASSQPKHVDDDFDVECKQGDIHDLKWTCENPNCECVNTWDFKRDIKWDVTKNEQGEYNYTELNVWMECPECKQVYEDDAKIRKRLSEASEYISRGSKTAKARQITYMMNILPVYRVPWKDCVIEFLDANKELKKGNPASIAAWNNKWMGLPWAEEMTYSDTTNLKITKYKRQTEPYPHELGRIMAIDTQGSNKEYHWWVIIRAWFKAGESKLVFEGRINTEEELIALHKKYNIPPNHTYIDIAWSFDKTAIWKMCANHRWYGLDGRAPAQKYNHGKKGDKLFSKARKETHDGKPAFKFTYHADSVKDLVATLRDGNGAKWELCKVSNHYIQHHKAEIKKEVSPNVWKWTEIKKDNNHLWDAEVMGMVGCLIHGYF